MTDQGRRIGQPGWVFIFGAARWHYVDASHRSLCGKWQYIGNVAPELGNNDSRDNCATCRKKLLAMSSHQRAGEKS